MYWVQTIIQIVIAAAIIYLAAKIRELNSYATKKGENLATKEDVEEITNEMEKVKYFYADRLESVRATLSSQLKTSGFRYEREYQILEILTDNLIELRNSTLNLRPVADYVDSTKSKEQIKQERLKKFFEARKNLYISREKKRPFFSTEIYEAIVAVEEIAHTESIDYEIDDPFEKGKYREYWDNAQKNQKEIIEKTDLALQRIRERVTKWESILEQ